MSLLTPANLTYTQGIPEERDPTTGAVIAAAIAVHRELGPGLLESAYEACISFELGAAGIPVRRQVELPIIYRGHTIDCGYRLDLLVAESVIVEVKSVDRLHEVHQAQLLTYLKLAKKRVGLLINFNTRLVKDGIMRLSL